jgi:hypothetical protein
MLARIKATPPVLLGTPRQAVSPVDTHIGNVIATQSKRANSIILEKQR